MFQFLRKKRESYDVIIVGSGATGGWAAKVLTELGLEVLLCEAGAHLNLRDDLGGSAPAPELKHPRQQTQSTCYAFEERTKHLFVDDQDNPYESTPDNAFLWIRMRLVGGRTALWNRVALRMSDNQFKAASIDGFGANWPIHYSDLEPQYSEIERFISVCGIKENLPEVPDGHFTPAALSIEALEFKQSLEARWPDRKLTALRQVASMRPFLPHGRLSNDPSSNGRDLPFYCSAGSTITAAKQTGRLSLRANAIVSRITTNRDGSRATGVVYVDSQSTKYYEASGKVIVLCASTIESTRILLNSASRYHPNGLGNSSGVLGHFLSEHTFGVGVTGRRAKPTTENGQFYIPNFRNIGGNTAKFLRGYGIQGTITPVGEDTTECQLWCFGEVLARGSNFVTLSATQKDRWGIPVPHIEFTFSDNELEMSIDQAEQIGEIIRAAGYDVIRSQAMAPPGSSMHEVGTARMGEDPKSSTLNSYGQCWDVPNVFVADGAAFVSAGFQNPTFTMMAIAGRASHYIAAELKRGASSLQQR